MTTTANSFYGPVPVLMGTDDGAGNLVPVASTGARAHVNPAAVSVGTGSTAVLAAGLAKNLLILTNDSANVIYVSTDGNAAVVGQGLRINPSGGVVVLDASVPTGAINAISGTAGSNLIVVYA